MNTVAITGASGYIARQLITALDKAERCGKVLGIDLARPGFQADKLEFSHQDVRAPSLFHVWQDKRIDVLVHLAFIVDPIHDEKKMFDVNVNGTLNVLKVCEKLSVPHVIIASSGTAYGAWPDNPPALKEDDPIRVFPPEFSYAHHKGLIEQYCADFTEKHPETIVNMVRPCVAYGPHTDNYLARFLKNMPAVFLPGGLDPDPLLGFCGVV